MAKNKNPDGSLEGSNDIDGPVDDMWIAMVNDLNGNAARMAGRTEKKESKKIVIDSEDNDDWVKSLPGHEGESEMHDNLSKKANISISATIRKKGGEGSGHHGHDGRPGKRGGSMPGDGKGSANNQQFSKNQAVAIRALEHMYGRSGLSNDAISARIGEDYLSGKITDKLGKKVLDAEKLVSNALIRSNTMISDFPNIRYRAKKAGIILEDVDGWAGNITTSIYADTLKSHGFTVEEFTKLLEDAGAAKIKPRKRTGGYSSYYD